MTHTAVLLVATAHSLDLATLLAVVAVVGMGGEANPLARTAYDAAGVAGLVAFKAAGTGVILLLVGSSRLRLSVAVLAGLAGAAVNAVAFGLVMR
jgi:hypothetical protein